MKRILILLMFIACFVLAFTCLNGTLLIISLLVLFPLFFFYCPLIFSGSKEEEKTEELKNEEKGKFSKWD